MTQGENCLIVSGGGEQLIKRKLKPGITYAKTHTYFRYNTATSTITTITAAAATATTYILE